MIPARLNFDQGLVVVRRGKGDKDRSTLLVEVGRDELRAHLRESKAQHQLDRKAGLAGVWMPAALDRKYLNAGRALAWHWVFSSRTLSADPRAGITCTSPSPHANDVTEPSAHTKFLTVPRASHVFRSRARSGGSGVRCGRP
jgi:hypothetical protein